MSEPSEFSSPTASRCANCLRCSGFSIGPSRNSITGTPISTTRPSVVDEVSRITATVTNAAIAPANRALTSRMLPTWARSLAPTLTTSPVARFFGNVAPSFAECRVTTWTVRYAPVSQFTTAYRCRMIPAPAWTTPTANSTAVHSSSRRLLPAATPSSIARPRMAGTNACAVIQSTPKTIPPQSVAFCPLATQSRYRAGER